MKTPLIARCGAIAALALAATGMAMADGGRAIDPNTFIPGHPASPTWGAAKHANGEHPAILQARLARQTHVDPNTFILGHPASPRWEAMPHENHEHPAVTRANLAHYPSVDPNTLILGHPASPRWTQGQQVEAVAVVTAQVGADVR